MTESTVTTRKCPGCGEQRDATSFLSVNRRAKCEPCRAKARARYARQGQDAARARNLWSKYRILPEDYDAMRAAQDYRCAICQTHEDDLSPNRGGRRRADGQPPAEGFRLGVDHCHETGRVRGLLCITCNVILGYARDSERLLRTAAEYVKA